MLFDIGAGRQVIGVSRYDTFPRRVMSLPRLGALLDPDYEGILRLMPDLVLTYSSQTELERRLTAGGIRVYSYRHAGIDGAIRTMHNLAALTGHEQEGQAAIQRLQRKLDAVRQRIRGRRPVRTLLVFGRERGTLRQIYAAGGIGFEHEILELAGGINVFAEARRESVQPSIETILTKAPEAIIELHAASSPDASTVKSDHEVWSRLASIPAVRTGHVRPMYGEYLSIPGPRMGEIAEAMARALHPDAF